MTGEKFREEFLEWADLVRKHYSKVKGIHNLKFRPSQQEAINFFAEGKSVNIVAPPGFGKSLPLFIIHSFYPIHYNLKSTYTVPTNSLMSSIMKGFSEVITSIDKSYTEKIGYVRLFDAFMLDKQMLFMNTVTQYTVTKMGVELYKNRILTNLVGWFLLIQDELHFYTNDKDVISSLIHYDLEYSKYHPTVISSATQPLKMVKMFNKKHWEIVFADPSEITKKDRLVNTEYLIVENDAFVERILDLITTLNISKKEKVIIFLNTKTMAHKVYHEVITSGIYSPDEVILLTSEVPQIIRKRFEEMLNNENSNIKVIISTQVAEVGIDNKAIKYVITQVSPLDSLVQRVGRIRLHRRDGELFILQNENISPTPYSIDDVKMTIELIKNWDSNTWNRALIDAKWVSEKLDPILGDKISQKPALRLKQPEITITPINLGMFLAHIFSHDSIISDDREYIDISNTEQLMQKFKQFLIIQQRKNDSQHQTERTKYGVITNAMKFTEEYCGVPLQITQQELKTMLDSIIEKINKNSLIKLRFKYFNITSQENTEQVNTMRTLCELFLTQ